MERSAKVAYQLADWLARHPIQPRGDIQPRFITPLKRPGPVPQPDFLLRDGSGELWYVRWPNGSLRWETTVSLRTRGMALPDEPILSADADEDDA